MTNKNDIPKIIEAYQEGTLSNEEKLDFETQLKFDTPLAAEWNLRKEIDQAINNPDALEMEDLLADIGNEFAQKHSSNKIKSQPKNVRKLRVLPIYKWGIAATIALIVGFLGWQLSQETNVSSQELFANYYEPYAFSVDNRSNSDDLKSNFEKGQKAYLEGDYRGSITEFTNILMVKELTSEELTEAKFYKGLAHLGNKESFLAEKELMEISDTLHDYSQQTEWYLALIALEKGEIETAKRRLKEVLNIASSGKFAKKAKELLGELE